MITVNPDCSTDVSILIGEAIKIILLQSMDFLSSEGLIDLVNSMLITLLREAKRTESMLK